MAGLKKVNGRGKNSTVPPKSNTKVVQIGEGFYYGKKAKRALYVNGAREVWERYTMVGQKGATSCGRQKPNIKCR